MRKLILSVITVCLTFVFVIAQINILSAQPEEGTRPATIMDNYQGETITISGEVFGQDYEIKDGGEILIVAKTRLERESPAVARTRILQPGEYSMKVPKDIGEVYIFAFRFKFLQQEVIPETAISIYWDNPVRVGSSDIKGIDILLQKEHREKLLSESELNR